jgi:hypothetical protein
VGGGGGGSGEGETSGEDDDVAFAVGCDELPQAATSRIVRASPAVPIRYEDVIEILT